MRESLFNLLENTGSLSTEAVIIRLFAAFVISIFIFISYRLSHNGSIYSSKFNVSLVTLAIITTTVMIVIGNNIALSLGMVGALSIVRFRTAIKDSRDTVYIFWAIVTGICCGAGDYLVGAFGSAMIFLVFIAGFGLIISNYSDTMLQAVFMMLFFVLIFMLMSGIFTPVSSMETWSQYVTYFLPTRYFVNILRAVCLKGSHFADMTFDFVMLSVFAVAINIVAVVTYRKQN